MAACLESEIALGATAANLSLRANLANLRWSEQVETYNDFLVVSPKRRSRLACGLYLLHRRAAVMQQDRRERLLAR